MKQQNRRHYIYLAGPDVFFQNAYEIGEAKKELCQQYGFTGCFPLDGNIDPENILTSYEKAKAISIHLEKMMDDCDIIIANMTPFRGVSMDIGTAFEAGYMRAQGKPVLGYSNVTPIYEERVKAFYRETDTINLDVDKRGETEIEAFGLTENLMIEIAINQSGFEVVRRSVNPEEMQTNLSGFEECLIMTQKLVHEQ